MPCCHFLDWSQAIKEGETKPGASVTTCAPVSSPRVPMPLADAPNQALVQPSPVALQPLLSAALAPFPLVPALNNEHSGNSMSMGLTSKVPATISTAAVSPPNPLAAAPAAVASQGQLGAPPRMSPALAADVPSTKQASKACEPKSQGAISSTISASVPCHNAASIAAVKEQAAAVQQLDPVVVSSTSDAEKSSGKGNSIPTIKQEAAVTMAGQLAPESEPLLTQTSANVIASAAPGSAVGPATVAQQEACAALQPGNSKGNIAAVGMPVPVVDQMAVTEQDAAQSELGVAKSPAALAASPLAPGKVTTSSQQSPVLAEEPAVEPVLSSLSSAAIAESLPPANSTPSLMVASAAVSHSRDASDAVELSAKKAQRTPLNDVPLKDVPLKDMPLKDVPHRANSAKSPIHLSAVAGPATQVCLA